MPCVNRRRSSIRSKCRMNGELDAGHHIIVHQLLSGNLFRRVSFAAEHTHFRFRLCASTDLHLSLLDPTLLRRDSPQCLLFRHYDLWSLCMASALAGRKRQDESGATQPPTYRYQPHHRHHPSRFVACRLGLGCMDGRYPTLLGCLYHSTCTRGAGTDDSRLSRALVHLARSRYPVRHPLGTRRGLVYGHAVRHLVRKLRVWHYLLEEGFVINSAGLDLVCSSA